MKRAGAWILCCFGLGLAAMGCDSDPDPFPPEELCPKFDYSNFDGQAPAVSFNADILPIFAQNCTLAGCHGDPSTPAAGLFLSPSPDDAAFPADAEARQSIVETYLLAPARTTPDRARVVPGEPELSFLMDKLDGSQNCIGVSCPGNDCGQRMPRGHDQLPAATRDTLRRWISQGAGVD
ncbi:MAG: hypothetical protein KC766_15490 [Myxococcales bacterium]|nr:hypothetical protein [Myxococcales bacterium]